MILSVESLRQPLTGIGRYTLQLLRGLRSHSEVSEVVCYAGGIWPDKEVDAWCGKGDLAVSASHPGLRLRGQVSVRAALRTLPFVYDLWFQLRSQQFRHALSQCADAVYHDPNYVLKPFDGCRVVTVHDFSHELFATFHPRERVRWLGKHLSHSIRCADQVITDSEFVKTELLERIPQAEGKVSAINLGVDECFRPRTSEETREILSMYGLEHKRFVLSAATLEPRKNLEGLLNGYLRLPEDLKREFPLILVGAPGWQSGAFRAGLAAAEVSGQVVWLGYVPEEHLTHLYAAATVFAFVSYYEGFGLPVAEAMASGTPVVASRVPSLSEVVGGAAEVVDPDDPASIAQGLERVIESKSAQRQLSELGSEHVKRFTWEGCIESTIKVYQNARR